MEPIIIIGMHRAGTSLLAGILKQSGVFIGNDLDQNFESVFFRNLNRWMFHQAGASWDNPYNFRFIDQAFKDDLKTNIRKHLYSFMSRNFHPNIQKLIDSDNLWGWKDPVNTFTSDVWNDIYPDANYIHIYRNPIDVAQSLKQRENLFEGLRGSKTRTGLKKKVYEYKLSNKRIYAQSIRVRHLDEGLKLWSDYTEKALSVQNCLHIRYESLLEFPENEIPGILKYLNIEPKENMIEQISKSMNRIRNKAFIQNEELVDLYKSVQNSDLIVRLNYHDMI